MLLGTKITKQVLQNHSGYGAVGGGVLNFLKQIPLFKNHTIPGK